MYDTIDQSWCGPGTRRRWPYDRQDFQLPKPKELDDASPEDVRNRATARIKSLRELIGMKEKDLAALRKELKEWEQIIGKE